jgi:hypothetical protein
VVTVDVMGPQLGATSPAALVNAIRPEGTAKFGRFRTGDDLSSDGQRFLMMKEGGGTDQTAAPSQIIVVQHFDEELKRLVPTK